MPNDSSGSMIQQGNFLHIDNALVDEVSSDRNTGFLIVSYSVTHPNGITTIEQLRLNVNSRTVILNSFRIPICFCDIHPGQRLNVTFTSRMTRSIPPQANAIMIVVQAPSRPSSNTTTDRILRVEPNQNRLITGMADNINSQTVFNITNATTILSRDGFPITLRALRPGQRVRIKHANFQTASIPPQTTAFHIQVI